MYNSYKFVSEPGKESLLRKRLKRANSYKFVMALFAPYVLILYRVLTKIKILL